MLNDWVGACALPLIVRSIAVRPDGSEEPSLLGASNPPGAYSAATVPEGGAGGDPGRTGTSSKSIEDEEDKSDIKSIYRLKIDYHKKFSKASFRQN